MTMTAECLKTYSPGIPLRLRDDGSVIPNDDYTEHDENPGEQIISLARQIGVERGISFNEALLLMRFDTRYRGLFRDHDSYVSQVGAGKNYQQGHQTVEVDNDIFEGENGADTQVCQAGLDYMKRSGETDFTKAVQKVLANDESLRIAYRNCYGARR